MRALIPTDRSEPLVEFGEVAEPAPASDEVVVAVEAFSINRGETFQLERPRRGWRPGKDIAGRVVRVAADGSPAVAAVTVLTASPQRPERLLSLGALAAVRDIQEAQGLFDVVLESVGGESLAGALRLLVPHGKLIWFGQASRRPVELDFFSYFAQTGATIRHFSYEDSEVADNVDLETLVRLVATGRLHPELGVIADWSQTAATIDALRARRIRGNAVLTIHTDHTSQPPVTSREHEMTTAPDGRAVLERLEAGDERAIRVSFAENAT